MFPKTLDSKSTYTIDDGTEFVDLSESIFDSTKAVSNIGTYYKVSSKFEMRPDLIAMSLYGNMDYTEMVMKYSGISNPFSIEKDDIVYSTAMASIYNPVKDFEDTETSSFNALKNYHKYIDKSKVPDGYSDVNNVSIVSSDKEANFTEKDENGIVVKDGKLYFGEVDENLQTVNSDIVNCAVNGTTIGEFINATIKNG